jgi:hypothetical protein
MPDLAKWYGTGPKIGTSHRAALAWQRIQDNPTSLVLIRAGAALPAQTLRIETQTGASNIEGDTGKPAVGSAIVYGIADHPTVAASDMQRGDRFRYADRWYTVVLVIARYGEVQASCEVEDFGP